MSGNAFASDFPGRGAWGPRTVITARTTITITAVGRRAAGATAPTWKLLCRP